MASISSCRIFKESSAIVVEEFRRTNDQAIESGRRLDDKAVGLVEWSSIALVIASALELPSMVQGQGIIESIVLLVTAVVLYVAIVILCLKALWPQDYQNPISIDWDSLYCLYLGKEEEECLIQIVSQYIEVIGINKQRASAKARYVRLGFFLLPILIIVLVLLTTRDLW